MRSTLLTGVSFMMTALVVGNAYVQRQQFYPSVVYITKSNSSMAVIYIQALVFILLFGKLMSKVFFGRLRAAEFEHLMERSWYAVTETCLAFTVFKDDFSPKFVALFSLLLFLKSFHWLAEDRVDFMERSPSVSLLFHFRIVVLAALLTFVDGYFMNHAYHSTVTKGASVQLVFGFEYAILLTIVVNTVIKYALHSVDLHSEHPWEGKAVCMLYAELLLGFVKVLSYVLFIAIMVRIYTLPLFAVRPMYLAMRAFKKALSDVVLSRRAIHNMNTWYPDATVDELAAADNVCIICREEMLAPTTKKLPCNHIFHKTCLRSWFQRQQTCPTCRLDVLRVPSPDQRQQQGGARAAAAAPQQQRPQQQPAPPFPMPPPPPFDPHLFAQMMNNARYGTPSQPSTAATTSSSTSTATSAGAMPFPPPFPLPFAFMPPAFSMPPPPPPMPPPSFSGLTDAELSQLEGTERANVEARVKCLRNIQVLLDAAVLEMQQYSSVVLRLNAAAAVDNSNAMAGDVKDKSSLITPELTGTRPKVKAEAEDEEKERIVRKMDAVEEEEVVGKKKSSPELSEVRKRWREKFDKNNDDDVKETD